MDMGTKKNTPTASSKIPGIDFKRICCPALDATPFFNQKTNECNCVQGTKNIEFYEELEPKKLTKLMDWLDCKKGNLSKEQ